MQATFLVTLSLPDDGSVALQDIAIDIDEDLSTTFDVVSVAPWARPSSNTLGTGPTIIPDQQTQPNTTQ